MGRSSPAIRFRTVVLPLPGRPHQDRELARIDADAEPVQGGPGLPVAIDLHDIDQFDERAQGCIVAAADQASLISSAEASTHFKSASVCRMAPR